MDGVRDAVRNVVSVAATVGHLVAFTAFHMACGAKEFAESGFGIPALLTTGASASIMACAFGGHANLAMNVVSKFYGKIDCATCNGWEALRCTSCQGTGKFQYLIVSSSGEGSSNMDELPTKACSECEGTGVMKCTECKGFAWKDGVFLDEVANLPTRALKAYKKLDVVNESTLESMEDPATAEFLLFTRPELELRRRIDEDVKEEAWQGYQEWRRMRLAGELEDDEPRQQILVATGTPEQPSVMKDLSYYKTRREVQAEVRKLEVPTRPADWDVPLAYPLKESDWSEEELKNPRKREERDVLLNAQHTIQNNVLNATWEKFWREQKIEELTKRRIEGVLRKQLAPEPKEVKPPPKDAAPKAAETKSKAAQTSKEDKKKKERRERAEKMAKQAAEREAALKKAKAKS